MVIASEKDLLQQIHSLSKVVVPNLLYHKFLRAKCEKLIALKSLWIVENNNNNKLSGFQMEYSLFFLLLFYLNSFLMMKGNKPVRISPLNCCTLFTHGFSFNEYIIDTYLIDTDIWMILSFLIHPILTLPVCRL